MLAESGDERALVRLYESVDRGATLGSSLRQWFGFGQRELTRRWQERLSDLAG